MQHHLGDTAGEKDLNRRMMPRTVRQGVDDARHAAVDVGPVLRGRAAQAGRVRDRGQVQDEVRRAAERGMRHHRVLDRGVGQDVLHRDPALLERHQRARRAARHVQPDWVARGRERRVAERHAERLADDLRGRGGAEELAAAAGRRAGAAAELGRLLRARARRGRSARQSSAPARHRRPSSGRSVTPPGTSTHGRSWRPGERHHHGRQTLVAGGHAEDAAPSGERSNQPPEDRRRVVSIGEAVEHRRRALRAAIAGVGAGRGEGDGAGALELVRRGLHEQADFPVAGVVAERDRRAIRRADPAVSREDEELRAADGGRLPAHAGVLRPAEDIAGRSRAQHLRRQRQRAHGTGERASTTSKSDRIVDVELIGVHDGQFPLMPPPWRARSTASITPSNSPRFRGTLRAATLFVSQTI